MFTTSCYEFSELTEMALDEVHGGSVKLTHPAQTMLSLVASSTAFLQPAAMGLAATAFMGR